MRNLKKAVAAVLCAAMVVVMLVGCGGKDMSGSKYCGTWTATTAEYAGLELAISDIFDGDVVLTLGEDGKCTFDVAGDAENGKWDEVDGGVQLDEDESLTFLEDESGNLVLDYEGVTLNFAK